MKAQTYSLQVDKASVAVVKVHKSFIAVVGRERSIFSSVSVVKRSTDPDREIHVAAKVLFLPNLQSDNY